MPDFPFLIGGGEMGALIRAHDWSGTTLGTPDRWPQSLRIAVRLMLNSRHPMYIFWGTEGHCLYNDAYRQSIGAERHPSSLGRPAREVWDEIWDIIGPQVEQVMSCGGATWHENQLVPITRDGVRDDVYWTYGYSPIDDESTPSGVGGVLVVCTETTLQVKSEQRLAAESERQRMAFQQMPGFVGVLTGPRHIYEYVNDACIEISGPRDFIGRSAREVFPELEGQDFFELLDRVYATGLPFVAQAMPIKLENQGENRFIDFIYHPIRDEAGVITGIFVGGYDVTELVRAKTAVEEVNASLERRVADALRERDSIEAVLRQAQKMEAVGQLTGGLAHDFNNLLTGISGSLELMQTRIARGDFDSIDRYVSRAQQASKRAAALTHRLLAFSRQQTLDPKLTDINRLVAGMADLIRRTVGPAVRIEVVEADALWAAFIDPNQLENALLNLCINARDAMPEGGLIKIETFNQYLDDKTAAESELAAGEYLAICVSDTGTGMTAEVAARAFDPFFTTKPMGEGTGLGLSMVYGFVRQSGGQVRIFSEMDQGTRISLYLPRHLDAAQAPLEEEVVLESGRGVGETILVVDDEPAIRGLIVEVLQEFGYRTLDAADGPGGLRMIQAQAQIDLLITDVGLPGGMNGRQLADASRAVRPGLKILFITGYAEKTVIGNGPLEPGMEILPKPFTMAAIGSRVRAILAR